jgi:type IV pilus assembly protein PilA
MISAMDRQAGFTWIELVMVLAVIGILALMAIPSMQEGQLRKQVKEGLALADVAKSGVQAAYGLSGEWPVDNKAAGLPDPDKIVGTLVSAVQVDRGAITVTYGNNASKVLAGKQITLRPAVVPEQTVVPIAWLCHGASVPKGMVVYGVDRTDLTNPMLPVECRGPPDTAK